MKQLGKRPRPAGRPAHHYLQLWFGLSDPAMEEALHDVALYREFAKLDGVLARLPDETTILRFQHPERMLDLGQMLAFIFSIRSATKSGSMMGFINLRLPGRIAPCQVGPSASGRSSHQRKWQVPGDRDRTC